jgi:hypothetical protein
MAVKSTTTTVLHATPRQSPKSQVTHAQPHAASRNELVLIGAVGGRRVGRGDFDSPKYVASSDFTMSQMNGPDAKLHGLLTWHGRPNENETTLSEN